jgi:hypothetical protein
MYCSSRNEERWNLCLTLSDLKLQLRSHAWRVQICRCGRHARLGHLNIRGIVNMCKNKIVDGLSCSDTNMQNKICESCVYGKSHRLPFPKKSSSRANGSLDSVHSDLCESMPVESVYGRITLFHDAYRQLFALVGRFSIENKSDVLGCFKKWKTQVECHINCRIRIL